MIDQSASASASKTSNQNGTTIRSQLLWASVFPLIFFGLLTILVTSTALYELTLKNSIERNTAQVQLISNALEQQLKNGFKPDSSSLRNILHAVNPDALGQVFLFDTHGDLLLNTVGTPETVDVTVIQSSLIAGYSAPTSKLLDSTVANEKNLISIAALSSGSHFIVLSEPWSEIYAPTLYYQLIFLGLWILGIAFSLGMLSVSVSRIIRPIALLVENATGAVPGSIFHPVPQHGPKEIRALINEFNQMVIRLAEQQHTLRQYAHKALLSQEEERQRLSHELHDGTLQDMVGLVQRVELCRNDLDTNPAYARQRLDDLHDLLNKSIEDIRRMSIALRPPVLEDFGLPIALDALCKDLQQDKPDLVINYSVLGENQRLQPDLELAVYRVVQEALTNIRKHVKDVSQVSVELTFGETEVKAVIKNNGAVFSNYNVNQFVQSGHLGLAGMYERARLFGGSLTINSDEENDTIVTIQMPYLQQ